jgi:hypothetical protein
MPHRFLCTTAAKSASSNCDSGIAAAAKQAAREGARSGLWRKAKQVSVEVGKSTATSQAAVQSDAEERLLSFCNAVGDYDMDLRAAQHGHAVDAARLTYAAGCDQDLSAQQHLQQAPVGL